MNLTTPPSPELHLVSPRRPPHLTGAAAPGFALRVPGKADLCCFQHEPKMRDDAPDPQWLDEMVKKLITVLKAQLDEVAKAGGGRDARSRAADARTLASLERTLERLSNLERERAAVREKKIAANGKDRESARAALERRLDKRLAAGAKKGTPGGS